MSEPKSSGESKPDGFLVSEMLAPGPMRTLSEDPGSGKPEPDEGWKIPAWPDDEVEGKRDATPEPVHAGQSSGLLHRLTHRG